MIVFQEIIQQINCFCRDKCRVAVLDKGLPWLTRGGFDEIVIVRVQVNVVLFQIGKELVCTQDICDLHQLVIVVLAMEKGFDLEDKGAQHTAQAPQIQTVIVHLHVDQKLWALKVATGHPDIVLGSGVIKFSQTPVNQSQFLAFMVDHDIVRLDVPVHDSL